MNPSTPFPRPSPTRTLDDFVAAFEAALARGLREDLADFLPEPAHPLHLTVLGELIRVELEHDWEQGRPRPLAEYRARFPEAFEDRDRSAAIAYEEYRLRRQGGEDPDPAEYARAFGIDTSGWPPRLSPASGEPAASAAGFLHPSARQYPAAHAAGSPGSSLLSVARSYQAFRLGTESGNLDSWMHSCGADVSLARVFGDLHRADPNAAARLADGLSSLPRVGDTFLGFRLLSELGRGAFGRVYLAQQESLANRLVALKVAPDVGGESQTLAQLQHTHIVPIYSLHRAGALQAVCMPYFGAVTLADVLGDLSRRPSLPQLGSDLFSRLSLRPTSGKRGALAETVVVRRKKTPSTAVPPGSPTVPLSVPEPSPAEAAPPASPAQATLKRLEGRSYVDAVVWLGCCLADGLAHAHERGILHRDLKPANILLSDEGTPLLLDFNLAEDTKLRGSVSAAVVGGTIPYMAPEQLAAFRGDRARVDERSDLFALGMILYELLTGQSPFPSFESGGEVDAVVVAVLRSRSTPPVSVRSRNTSVSPAVWSILRRCLDPDPARRYASARQLQEDLQRQLDSQPLKYAPEPSLRERVRKQIRRSPGLVVRLVIVAALLLVGLAAGVAHLAEQDRQIAEQKREAEGARAELERRAKEAERARADDERRKKEAEAAERVRLEEQEKARAKRSRALKDIQAATFLLSIHDGPARQEEGVRQARDVLGRYGVLGRDDWQKDESVARLSEQERKSLAGEVGELLMLLARCSGDEGESLDLLARAEACFGETVPPPLWLQKVDLLKKRDPAAAAALAEKARARPSEARDHALLARGLMAGRLYRKAEQPLRKAVALDPKSATAWFLLGVCQDALEFHDAAIGSYNVCLALNEEFHGGHFNRGLAHYRRGQLGEAVEDFTRAIELRSESADAHLNRGLARQRLKQLKEAEADFSRALELNPERTQVIFLRAQVRLQLKDQKGAEADWQEGLKREPRDDKSWNARGQFLLRRKDYEGALACFDRGLKLFPDSRSCLNAKAHVLGEYLHRPRESLEVMNRVVERYPDYVFGYAGRGVLLARLGRREEAIKDAGQALARDGSAEMSYRVACVHALNSRQTPADAEKALQLLHDALRRGFGAEELPDDEDLRPLHSHPEFARLSELARNLRPRPLSPAP